MSSDPKFDEIYLSNFATLNVLDLLRRIPGVGRVSNIGSRYYAMQIWVQPDKLANFGLTVADLQNALKDQNRESAAGVLGQQPVAGLDITIPITTWTRCCHHSGRCVEWFIGCVLKSADSYYAWQSFSGRGVNLHNLRMRIRTAQNSGVEHMRHGDVHRELSKTGGFIKSIVAGDVFANIFHRSHSPFLILSAAAMTASSIFT